MPTFEFRHSQPKPLYLKQSRQDLAAQGGAQLEIQSVSILAV